MSKLSTGLVIGKVKQEFLYMMVPVVKDGDWSEFCGKEWNDFGLFEESRYLSHIQGLPLIEMWQDVEQTWNPQSGIWEFVFEIPFELNELVQTWFEDVCERLFERLNVFIASEDKDGEIICLEHFRLSSSGSMDRLGWFALDEFCGLKEIEELV